MTGPDMARLLRVLESNLALMIMGERFDDRMLLDTVDRLIDAVGTRDYSLHASGVELYHRLDLALRDESFSRGEVVRLGYAYSGELRRVFFGESSAARPA